MTVVVNDTEPMVCPAVRVIVSKEIPLGGILPEVAVPPSALYVTVVPAGSVGDALVAAVYVCPPVETFFTQTAPVTVVPWGILLPKAIADGVSE